MASNQFIISSNFLRRLTPASAIFTSCVLVIILASQQQQLCEAKRLKSQKNVERKCQNDECLLSESHFALYSNVKRALDRNFDLAGKEIFPLLSSVELLKRRFSRSEPVDRATTKSPPAGFELIDSLLSNETLKNALKVFQSDDGRALIDSYRASINGKGQNLACSPLRIQDIERLSRKLESNQELSVVFSRIHENFVKRSAKKCLKRSCTSIENSMSRLDSILTKKKRRTEDDENSGSTRPSADGYDGESGSNGNSNKTGDEQRRAKDFELEELELCKFFKKSNESDCTISGRELSEISLLLDQRAKQEQAQTISPNELTSIAALATGENNGQEEKAKQRPPKANEYFEAYYKNSRQSSNSSSSTEGGANEQRKLEEAGRLVMAQCKPIRNLLEYNLYALNWYRGRNIFSEKKFNSRSFWCPSLFYWLQMDRLCGEVETFVENCSNSIGDSVVNSIISNSNSNENKIDNHETYQY